ncbi:MAG TPA: hypothetical protein VHQ65_02635 [Thermoanaerobaculia bacterium]|nr:hypothetical protein [Thermoanaerobaculia bacterium]
MLSKLRKTIVPATLVAALLLTPAAAVFAAPPQDAETGWTRLDPASLLQGLLGWLFGEAGADMDPDGVRAAAGADMDPNGLTTDAGSDMDPNGGTTEAGADMDPNGFTASGGDAGADMDPNG